jgi:DNA-binding GntR family transcriptional regulator
VRRDPDRGYVIAPFDVHTSDETFDARTLIEVAVIDQVVGQVPPDELRELRHLFEAMAVHLVGDRFVDFDAYLDANFAFHAGLVALAHNSLLDTTFGALSIKSVMTRSFGSTAETSQRFIEAQRRLMDAVEAGDREAARTAAQDYCTLAKDRVREILAQTGGRL